MQSPTISEFEILPDKVKRQCFSSLERLRVAQNGNRANSYPQDIPSFTTPRRPSKPTFRPSFRRAATAIERPSTRSRKQSVATPQFSREDVQLFLSLPEKLQRQHYTPEEQILLLGGYQQVLPDAADEAVFNRLGARHCNRSEPSIESLSSSQSSIYCSTLEDPTDEDMDKDMMDSFRWLEDDDLDLRLDDYHLQLADAVNQPAKPPSRRPSFRRTLSLTNMPFAKDLRSSNDSCTKQPPSTTSAQFPSLQPHSSHHKRNFSFSNPLTKTPIFNPPDGLSTVDASAAKHYQDPEARLKLRVYLASPQKFDEALEFGFPSLDASQGPTRPLSRRPSVSNVKPIQAYSLGGGDFFDDKDDLTSFFKDPEDDDDDDDEDDTATLPDPDSPNTPSDLTMTRPSAHRFQTSVPRSSQSTSSTRPPMWHSTTDPSSSYGWAGNREMTLRMTLTRPDLRADESILYPKDDRDPLALEDLPLEGGDIWSNLKGKEGKEGGRLGRLWKRVSRKSSAN